MSLDSGTIAVKNECIVTQKWSGAKSYHFSTWNNLMLHVALAKVSVDDGFTALYQTIKREDQGGAFRGAW